MTNLNNVILGTGNYYDVKSGNTVSVTGDGRKAWGYFGLAYRKLAPKLVTYTPYAEKYEELLKLKEDINKVQQYLKYRKQIEDEYIRSYYDILFENKTKINWLITVYSNFSYQLAKNC